MAKRPILHLPFKPAAPPATPAPAAAGATEPPKEPVR